MPEHRPAPRGESISHRIEDCACAQVIALG